MGGAKLLVWSGCYSALFVGGFVGGFRVSHNVARESLKGELLASSRSACRDNW